MADAAPSNASDACKQCEVFKGKALQSKIVKHMIKSMEKLGCPFPESQVVCRECHPNEGIIGGFISADVDREGDLPAVLLCQDNIDKFKIQQPHVTRTLAHELIHAYDHCRAKVDWNDCLHIACSEVRAANLSGDCFYKNELMRRNYGFAGQGQKCARRRAILSVEGHSQCKENAALFVDQIFEKCYADKVPFEGITPFVTRD